jgi:hypothetical protein
VLLSTTARKSKVLLDKIDISMGSGLYRAHRQQMDGGRDNARSLGCRRAQIATHAKTTRQLIRRVGWVLTHLTLLA